MKRMVLLVLMGLAAMGGMAQAKPLGLHQAARIAERFNLRTVRPGYETWVTDCHRGARRDYAICTANAAGGRIADEADGVIVWALPHGYGVRFQEPAFFTPNRIWLTR